MTWSVVRARPAAKAKVAQLVEQDYYFNLFSKFIMDNNTVELNLTNEEFIALAKEAHMQDLTLNQYINKILKEYIDEVK